MSKNLASKTIDILNPLPGGSRYTSMRRALSFERRGEAEFRPNGLFFLRVTQEQRKAAADRRREEEIYMMRGGVFWWNGADPGSLDPVSGRRTEAHHRPFENQAIPGPQKPWCRRWIGEAYAGRP